MNSKNKNRFPHEVKHIVYQFKKVPISRQTIVYRTVPYLKMEFFSFDIEIKKVPYSER